MSEPKALLNKLPHERMAVRKPSSLRLYHFERRNKAPCHFMRLCAKRSPVTPYREKRTLAETQEETRQKSTNKVTGNSGQDRDETPKDHTSGEVYGGFPDIIEEHIPVSLRCGSQQRSDPDHEQTRTREPAC